MEVREYVSSLPFFKAIIPHQISTFMARFLLGQNYRFILSGYEPRLVETFEFCTKIKIQNSVPNSKNGRSVTYVYVDYDNVKTMVQHNPFNGWYCILYLWKRLPD